jgi:2-methylcitrate dehydratase PrpD
MSIRYDVAVGMLDGQAYLEQFTEERIKEREVVDLAARVDVDVDPEMDAVYPELYAGKVTVETRDGRKITRRVDYSRGMPENPMDEAEVRAKFLSLATASTGPENARAILGEVEAALDAPSVRKLAEALGRVPLEA